MMTTQQIIEDSVRGTLPPGMSIGKFFGGIKKILENPNNKLVQIGNTVFLMKRVGEDTIEFHTFSKENPQNLAKNFVGAAKLLRNQGMKKAITYAANPGFLRLAKMTGLPVQVKQTTNMQQGKQVPSYLFEVSL